MFFNGWYPILRIILIGALAYISLVALLRISGKRTLSKMNAFDLIVTVAFGSTLASGMLSKDVSLSETVVAFAMLIGLQFVIAWISVRSDRFQSLIKSKPRLLVYQGRILDDALRAERVTTEEVLAAARSSGVGDISNVTAMILETDGKFSVMVEGHAPATLRTVRGAPDDLG